MSVANKCQLREANTATDSKLMWIKWELSLLKKIIFTWNAIFKTQKLAGGKKKNVKNGITQFVKT